MTIRNRYPLDIENIINEIKSKKAYVVVPAFFGFTYAKIILNGVISAPREKFLELESLVNSKEETAGIENLPLSVIPIFRFRLDRGSHLPPIRDSVKRCIRETFEHNLRDHKKSVMYFITGDYSSGVSMIHDAIKEVANSPEFQDKIAEIRITFQPYTRSFI